MISPSSIEFSRTRKFILCSAAVMTLAVLSGCATTAEVPPASDNQPVSVAEPAPEALPEVVQPEAVTCPEPEPPQPLVCPPPPKPKPCPICPVNKIDGKMLLGAVEYVKLSPPGQTFAARIDSGAELTTLAVADLVRFERDGEKWVKFDLTGEKGETTSVERQILRRVKASQIGKEGAGKFLVVMMSFTIGSKTDQVEMVLINDEEAEQPISIGRNFLHNNAIIDVSQKFIAK